MSGSDALGVIRIGGASEPKEIAIVGCGHVGLVVAAGLAELGHSVVGIDRRADLVDALAIAEVPFYEAGLTELVERGLRSRRLRFTTSYEDAIPGADFIFLAVDTPGIPGGAADLRNIRSAARSIAEGLNGKRPIIVNKSTSPIGTGETIEAVLRAVLADRYPHPPIVSNPEFLRQGRAVYDFFNPDRIVIGSRSEVEARLVAELYAGLAGDVIVTDLRTAEMIKYVANSFLATRISFINEISRLCDHLGVDVDRVVDGIAADARIGRHFFQPGIGFGGSCFPKDVAALRYMGDSFGVATPVLSAVEQVNQTQRTSAVRKLRTALGDLEGRRIGIWGVTFKGGTEDVRESPAVDVINLLLNEGAELQVFDPTHPVSAPERIRDLYCPSAIDAASGVEALAILTDWPEFAELPLEQLEAGMSGRVIFDGRNILDKATLEARGFHYIGIGRGAHARAAQVVAA